ncbi:MAG: gamma-glutamyl-gamma-aminobutyrate hydrolase family protein [Actinomycetota bacterium]
MTSPPLIGLSGRRISTAVLEGWPEPLHRLDADFYLTGYAEGVLEAGGLPVHIPCNVDPAAIAHRLDGIILTGGADIAPDRYGGETHPDLISPELYRDELEFGLFEEALRRDLPVLGVCRGLQLINVAYGGTLHQHVPEHLSFDQPITDPAHKVVTIEGSRLHELYGPTIEVNSLHHQTVDRVGDGVTVTARADDGTVEGLEVGDRILAVQWHPEMMVASRPNDPSLRWLIDRAAS